MTNFLIVYDRAAGALSRVMTFDSEEEARKTRLGLELLYRREARDVEVVLLQANDLESVMRTHARYFSNAGSLLGKFDTDKMPA